MAVKTITIDIEAYALLSRRKQDGRSLSQVIKEHFGRQPTVAGFRALLGTVRLGDRALEAMEKQVRDHTASPARAVSQ